MEARSHSRRDPVETIWVLFCSIRFAVVLNVGLALVAMVGTVIPQMPAGIQNFPLEFDRFMQGARSRYGVLADPLHWAGFFDLYNSLWFRMLVAIVVFSIIICTLNRWQPIWRLVTKPNLYATESFMGGLTEKAEFRAVPLPPDQARSALAIALKKGRYRVLSSERPGDATLYLYGDKHRWSKLVTFVSHAALVLLILVAAGMMNIGWREQSVLFKPGEPVSVGHGTTFQVRNDKFWIEYYPDGKAIKEYKNTLTVIEGGKEVLSKTIIVNDPLRYKDINFFLVSYQPLLRARVLDGEGKPVALRAMGSKPEEAPVDEFGRTLVDFNLIGADNLPLDYIQFNVGEQVITLELTYYQDVSRGEGENPPVYVRAYLDKQFERPIYDTFLPRTGELRLPGFEQLRFDFGRDTATVLEVATDPGLALPGSLFMVMAFGFTFSLYTSFTRVWARIVPSAERPGSVNVALGGLAEKNKVSFEREFEQLATRARDQLAGRSTEYRVPSTE